MAKSRLQRGALGFVGGLTLKRFGQLRGGRDTGVQPLTGYDEWDGDAKASSNWLRIRS